MVLVISQETFDAVVQENLEELGMSMEEAVNDAREQFAAQGVNLSNLVMPATGGADVEHLVVKALKALNDLTLLPQTELDEDEIVRQCGTVAEECAKGIPERVLATKSDGYGTLLRSLQLQQLKSPGTVKVAAMTAMTKMLDGNPDPLEEQGFKELLGCLYSSEPALVQASLECCLNCCVRHEQNRQNLVSNGLLSHLERVFEGRAIEVARLWQALVQDDDVRVPFGNAHENARAIVEDHGALCKLSKAFKAESSRKDQALLLSCLRSLSVRNEYCQAVADELGLSTLLDLLVDPDLNRDVVRESLKLIKTLAGNDNVKKDIQVSGGVSVIVNSISRNLPSKPICSAGCDAMAALALRSPDNAKQVVEAGGAQLLAQIMQTHMDSAAIMTSCCNAIRNIVSRCRDLAAEFVALDVESLLHSSREMHPGSQDAVKAALRDLGLKVHLKEMWTGNPAAAASARGDHLAPSDVEDTDLL